MAKLVDALVKKRKPVILWDCYSKQQCTSNALVVGSSPTGQSHFVCSSAGRAGKQHNPAFGSVAQW